MSHFLSSASLQMIKILGASFSVLTFLFYSHNDYKNNIFISRLLERSCSKLKFSFYQSCDYSGFPLFVFFFYYKVKHNEMLLFRTDWGDH